MDVLLLGQLCHYLLLDAPPGGSRLQKHYGKMILFKRCSDKKTKGEIMKNARLIIIAFAALLLGGSPVWAQMHSSHEPDAVPCSMTHGPYRVHFTAYQKPKALTGSSYLEQYCEELPLLGEALITLDVFRTYGGEIVRDVPVAVRVVEGMHDTAAKPVLERAPKLYPSGIIELRPNFTHPGVYHIMVVFGDQPSEDNTVMVPLRVGGASKGSGVEAVLKLALVPIILGALGYAMYRHTVREKTKPPA